MLFFFQLYQAQGQTSKDKICVSINEATRNLFGRHVMIPYTYLAEEEGRTDLRWTCFCSCLSLLVPVCERNTEVFFWSAFGDNLNILSWTGSTSSPR